MTQLLIINLFTGKAGPFSSSQQKF